MPDRARKPASCRNNANTSASCLVRCAAVLNARTDCGVCAVLRAGVIACECGVRLCACAGRDGEDGSVRDFGEGEGEREAVRLRLAGSSKISDCGGYLFSC